MVQKIEWRHEETYQTEPGEDDGGDTDQVFFLERVEFPEGLPRGGIVDLEIDVRATETREYFVKALIDGKKVADFQNEPMDAEDYKRFIPEIEVPDADSFQLKIYGGIYT